MDTNINTQILILRANLRLNLKNNNSSASCHVLNKRVFYTKYKYIYIYMFIYLEFLKHIL